MASFPASEKGDQAGRQVGREWGRRFLKALPSLGLPTVSHSAVFRVFWDSPGNPGILAAPDVKESQACGRGVVEVKVPLGLC